MTMILRIIKLLAFRKKGKRKKNVVFDCEFVKVVFKNFTYHQTLLRFEENLLSITKWLLILALHRIGLGNLTGLARKVSPH